MIMKDVYGEGKFYIGRLDIPVRMMMTLFACCIIVAYSLKE